MQETGTPHEYSAQIPAQPWGSIVEYYLTATNSQGEFGSYPLNAPGNLHYFAINNGFSDALESDTAWFPDLLGNTAASGLWTRADPVGTVYEGHNIQPEDDHTDFPGTDCFVTGNGSLGGSAGENDVDHGKTTLLSPVFDLTGGHDIQISYWRWYTNSWGYNPSEDYWSVDISNDGGQTWSSVEYTYLSSSSWQQRSIDLADFFAVPDLVQLRFIAEDIGGGSLVEAAVDDLTIIGIFDPVSGISQGDAPENPGVGLAQNMPNPFNPRTVIPFNLERAGPATLTVYDARGRLVSVLLAGELESGDNSAVWDGTDRRGRSVPSGAYVYVLETGTTSLARRMLLLR
jgi:hypothetical protein